MPDTPSVPETPVANYLFGDGMATSSLDIDMLVQRSLRRADSDLLAIGENGRLNSSAVSDGLLGRHHTIGLLPVKKRAKHRPYPRHPRGAAHKHELVDIDV